MSVQSNYLRIQVFFMLFSDEVLQVIIDFFKYWFEFFSFGQLKNCFDINCLPSGLVNEVTTLNFTGNPFNKGCAELTSSIIG